MVWKSLWYKWVLGINEIDVIGVWYAWTVAGMSFGCEWVSDGWDWDGRGWYLWG